MFSNRDMLVDHAWTDRKANHAKADCQLGAGRFMWRAIVSANTGN
jgi:hypothetical protein